jgi:hypothetical protein
LLGSDVRTTSRRPATGKAAYQRANGIERAWRSRPTAWRSQPVPHDFSPAQRAVKHDGYLAGATTWQYALYNVHVPYNVHALQLQFASSLADSLQSFAIDRRTVPAERKSA